jgi:hypothetical protein
LRTRSANQSERAVDDAEQRAADQRNDQHRHKTELDLASYRKKTGNHVSHLDMTLPFATAMTSRCVFW